MVMIVRCAASSSYSYKVFLRPSLLGLQILFRLPSCRFELQTKQVGRKTVVF
jgi:hypothetical protein